MKIELKAIEHSAAASQETTFYHAALYVDGRKIGDVANEGTGGPDMFHGDRRAYEAADAWCRANLPKWSLSGDPGDLHETTLEVRCGELLAAHLYRRDYQRAIRTKVLLRLAGRPGIYQIPHKGAVDQALAHARARYPDATILNDLPVEQAVAIYRSSLG